jgi:hypothetical protein
MKGSSDIMNDDIQGRRIAQALRETAQQEIPDTMNLLPDIQRQAAILARRGGVRGLSLLVALVLMLGAGTAAYAIMTATITGDPGIEGADAANLVTDLNLTQTLDDVELTLEWAYTDAHRFAIGYSVTAPEGQEGVTYLSNVSINDEADSFSMAGGGGGGGGGGVSRESEYSDTIGIAFGENPPDELAVRLGITLIPQAPPDDSGMGGGMGSGGGGGGGSGGGSGGTEAEVTPEPGISLIRAPEEGEAIGPFEFTFTLPYLPAVEVAVDQAVESSGVTVTLQSLSVSPSTTQVDACFAPSDQPWLPQAALAVDDLTIPASSWEATQIPVEDGPLCGRLTFYAPYAYAPTTFVLTIDRLITSYEYTQERAEQFRDLLAEQGIEISIDAMDDTGFSYSVDSEDQATAEAVQRAYDDVFTESLTGLWTFEIEIPGQ